MASEGRVEAILLKVYGNYSIVRIPKSEALQEFTNAGKVVEMERKFRIEKN